MTYLLPASMASHSNMSDPHISQDVSATGDSSRSSHQSARQERLSREQRAREAVLLSFSDSLAPRIDLLAHLSRAEWKRLLSWLDVSGLALYFLDRLRELGLHETLPQAVTSRLLENMHDNSRRTWGMIHESVSIQQEFQAAGLSYAVMKGISFCPDAVPRPELRHQFDLDYLIAEPCAPAARQILERMGYRVQALMEDCWEFKKNETPDVSAKDLYKDLPYRGVELHIESAASTQRSRLARTIERPMYGIAMPVFSPVDLFLGQAMHVFKDVCSGFSRASHLLEFYRHVRTKREETSFWMELRASAEGDRRGCLGIGIATYLVTILLGDFAPEALTVWTVEPLSPAIRLWVDRYGRRSPLGMPPGTKLYLLLQKELEAEGISSRRPARTSLLPTRLPPAVIQAAEGEGLSTRIARYRVQLRFVLSRLRFHTVEGIRFAIEGRRWRQLRKTLP